MPLSHLEQIMPWPTNGPLAGCVTKIQRAVFEIMQRNQADSSDRELELLSQACIFQAAAVVH